MGCSNSAQSAPKIHFAKGGTIKATTLHFKKEISHLEFSDSCLKILLLQLNCIKSVSSIDLLIDLEFFLDHHKISFFIPSKLLASFFDGPYNKILKKSKLLIRYSSFFPSSKWNVWSSFEAQQLVMFLQFKKLFVKGKIILSFNSMHNEKWQKVERNIF